MTKHSKPTPETPADPAPAGETPPAAPAAPPAASSPAEPSALLAQAQGVEASLVLEAHALVARIKAELLGAARRYYVIGECLKALQKKDVLRRLGYESWGDLVLAEFGFSATTARKIVRVTKPLSPEACAALGIERADALLELAAAEHDHKTPQILSGQPIELWDGGPKLDIAVSSVADIRKAAKAVRLHEADLAVQGSDPAPGTPQPRAARRRGRGATVEERARVTELSQWLKDHGIAGNVHVLATRPGKPSKFRLDGLYLDGVDFLLQALRSLPGRSG